MVQRDECRGGGGEGSGGEEEKEAPTASASCYIGDLLADRWEKQRKGKEKEGSCLEG